MLSLLFRRNAARAYRDVRGRLAQQNAFTAELIGGIRATRAFGRNEAVHARYAALNRRTAESWRDTVFHFSLFFALVDLALRATTVGMFENTHNYHLFVRAVDKAGNTQTTQVYPSTFTFTFPRHVPGPAANAAGLLFFRWRTP